MDSNYNDWQLGFYNCVFLNNFSYSFHPSHFPNDLTFSWCEFQNAPIFTFMNLPISLNFSGTRSVQDINLTNSFVDSIRKFEKHLKCNIILDDAEIEKFNFFYDDFHLAFNEHTQYEKKLSTYDRVLDNFKKRGYTKSYNMVDEEFKDFKLSSDFELGLFLEKYWWNYGHSKHLIFRNTSILLGLFVLLNSYLIKKQSLMKAYRIGKINDILINDLKKNYKSNVRKWIGDNWLILKCSFFYTTLIFFGFKLSSKYMNYRRPVGVIYIYIIYLSGLFCTVFIVNYFLFK